MWKHGASLTPLLLLPIYATMTDQLQTETGKKFSRKHLRDWKKYEQVRASGKWNMWDLGAQEATGLDRDTYLFTLRNYDALKEAAGEVI
jgi:hypothetical protein